MFHLLTTSNHFQLSRKEGDLRKAEKKLAAIDQDRGKALAALTTLRDHAKQRAVLAEDKAKLAAELSALEADLAVSRAAAGRWVGEAEAVAGDLLAAERCRAQLASEHAALVSQTESLTRVLRDKENECATLKAQIFEADAARASAAAVFSAECDAAAIALRGEVSAARAEHEAEVNALKERLAEAEERAATSAASCVVKAAEVQAGAVAAAEVQERLRVAVEAMASKEALLHALEAKCESLEAESEALRRALAQESAAAAEARRSTAQAAAGFEAATWALRQEATAMAQAMRQSEQQALTASGDAEAAKKKLEMQGAAARGAIASLQVLERIPSSQEPQVALR